MIVNRLIAIALEALILEIKLIDKGYEFARKSIVSLRK